MVSDCSFDPVIKLLVLVHRFHLHHGFLKTDGESSEIVLAQFVVGFLVHGHTHQVPKPASVFVQLPLFHFEGVEFCVGPSLAHDVLEGLGEIIDHVVPDVFVPVGIKVYASLDISIDFLDLVVDPFVNVWASDVSQEDEGAFEGIPHGMGSPI